MKVKYTYTRPVVGLHGVKTVRVKVLGYEIHQNETIATLDDNDTILIPHCRADLKLTILIGLLRWRLGMKRFQVRAFLRAKGVSISKGAISDRSLDFLLLFKALQKSRTGKIKSYFDRKGGVILHIDGTHKSGGKVVFVLQEGFEDIIVDAGLIPNEASEFVEPILALFKESYDSPLVVVRDMALGLELAVTNIFPDSKQQICQIHFIRDLEKDLVTMYHKGVKSSIIKHKLTPKLRSLRDYEGQFDKITGLEQRWIHIAVDYLLHPIVRHVKWISRPIAYYLHYRRVKEISGYVRRLLRYNVSNNLYCKPLMELDTCLKSVLADPKVLESYRMLDKTLDWLEKLREQLRISRKDHLKATPSEEIDIDLVKTKVDELLKTIRDEGDKLSGKYSGIAAHINAGFAAHWDELFVPDPIVNGKRIHLKRHNNSLDLNFEFFRHHVS